MSNEFLNAIKELRTKSEKRNFDQTLDLIINLKDFDVKRDNVNVLTSMPHMVKKIKICAFLEKPSTLFDRVISKNEFDVITPKQIKKMIKNYDICISIAKLMPEIAKRFGRVLGPLGKMPDPKTGCVIMNEDEATLKRMAAMLEKMIKIKSKEASIKVAVGKEKMKDEDLAENASAIYNAVLNGLPKRKENVRNVLLKFTMSKTVKVKMEK